MTIELLELKDGGASPEFEEADIAAVRGAVHARFGTLEADVMHGT